MALPFWLVVGFSFLVQVAKNCDRIFDFVILVQHWDIQDSYFDLKMIVYRQIKYILIFLILVQKEHYYTTYWHLESLKENSTVFTCLVTSLEKKTFSAYPNRACFLKLILKLGPSNTWRIEFIINSVYMQSKDLKGINKSKFICDLLKKMENHLCLRNLQWYLSIYLSSLSTFQVVSDLLFSTGYRLCHLEKGSLVKWK